MPLLTRGLGQKFCPAIAVIRRQSVAPSVSLELVARICFNEIRVLPPGQSLFPLEMAEAYFQGTRGTVPPLRTSRVMGSGAMTNV
jgi:hypothetical protein